MNNLVEASVYDCPSWNSLNPIRGEYILLVNYIEANALNTCDFISIKDKIYVIYRKVYNIDNSCIELWLQGEAKISI